VWKRRHHRNHATTPIYGAMLRESAQQIYELCFPPAARLSLKMQPFMPARVRSGRRYALAHVQRRRLRHTPANAA